ncbi:hypothetical protein C2S53_019116 [Perilla frutescens var. hirtella]|uniref:HAT C-terminal dimerisation domain-containing protein n=1 Tax=Perilla frutescens var. hirtella TaxID=608512 RepID=A0AAD4JGS5_PERFH|nr:hypothetical protein C2S53_019116 [Perilla frutescens var. hirtella]
MLSKHFTKFARHFEKSSQNIPGKNRFSKPRRTKDEDSNEEKHKEVKCRECVGFSHYQDECPNTLKRKNKSYSSTLSESDDPDESRSDEECVSNHIAFMTHSLKEFVPASIHDNEVEKTSECNMVVKNTPGACLGVRRPGATVIWLKSRDCHCRGVATSPRLISTSPKSHFAAIMLFSIKRIKEHIAQIKGNVSSCTKASKEDQEICRKFKKVIDQARALTVFLYAHHKVLAMMRSFTKKKDIMRPGVTRFASAFLTLQTAYTTVVSLTFWSGVASCLEVFTPLIKVLRIVDSDRKPSMGFVYGELVQAKEDIKIAEHSIPKNYEPIIEVIDARIKDRLDSPLYLTAYVLNPFYHYKNPLLHLEHDVAIGMIECVDIMFPGDVDLEDKILNEEFPMYRDRVGLFGKSVVVKGCSLNDARFDPASWWSNFGSRTPNLQRLAMRILSLTNSSSGCERNWSAFEGVIIVVCEKLCILHLVSSRRSKTSSPTSS